MKKYIVIILILFIFCGCVSQNNINTKNDNGDYMKIKINDIEYNVELEDNNTSKELFELLPLDFTMEELNGNEKYVYLDSKLSTDAYYPNYIKAGDIMLYGDNCLVIFYKSFETKYSYTKIGHIDNLPELKESIIKVQLYK